MTTAITKPGKVGPPFKYNGKSTCNRIDTYLKKVPKGELPTLVGLAKFLGVVEDTIHDWKKTYPDFETACQKILDRQKEKLMQDGMYNKDANATMAIFLLKNNHGMADKQEQIHKGEYVVHIHPALAPDPKEVKRLESQT